jgi:putative membrane protein
MNAVQLLRNGEALVIFPEAYPVIDPQPTPRNESNTFLPFRPGFARLAALAERDGHTRVTIVPAGFTYAQNGEWQVTLRFGPPLFRQDFAGEKQFVQAIEERVCTLSSEISHPIEEVVEL